MQAARSIVAVNSTDRTRQNLFDILISYCHCEERSPATKQSQTDQEHTCRQDLPINGSHLRCTQCSVASAKGASQRYLDSYKFSSLSVSTMLSLRIIAPEIIMVPKTI